MRYGISIKGYKGIYCIDKKGQVYSMKRQIKFNLGHGQVGGYYLKPILGQNGYLTVTLNSAGHKNKVNIHRLLGEHFIKGCRPGYIINHKNGIKTDNRLQNLEWTTYANNSRHAFRHKLIGIYKDQDNKNTCLTIWEVRKIKQLLTLNFSQRDIARLFNISRGPVDRINRGISWQNVKI